ncbi:MAG: glutamate--cysteine ligase [Woeseiaceae bacterium]|nr:glutamate--cysteine ligase [Woeseiaceae bacterium]
MSNLIEKRIRELADGAPNDVLCGGLKGVEKESLRVAQDGHLSQRPHPKALGSALTNQFITTDFSEALLEFVTPAHANTWETLRVLCEIHQFTYERIDEELLWTASMPCLISDGSDIPLAYYGDSNVGRMKTIYRNGLGYRYGRKMQTIAGVHYNYSLPMAFWPHYQELEKSAEDAGAFRSRSYLGLVRNFRRFDWLVLYLFGASPALCKSFFGADTAIMPSFDKDTFYQPFGTSLRMSDLGYNNQSQAGIRISLNSIEEYISNLSCAICTPDPRFEKIGIKVDGERRQLNTNQLQIENEYYSPIRPKRVAKSGERPTVALRRGGIEYVEVRSLDLNIFDPVGINQNTMRFMEAFLIYCLLEESPLLDEALWGEIASNHSESATRGRDPDFRLIDRGRERTLAAWGGEIVNNVRLVAEIIDKGEGRDDYQQAVDAQAVLIENPDATPSARVLDELKQNQQAFYHFAMASARGHKEYFSELEPLSAERLQLYEAEAKSSIERQKAIEQADQISFEEYLANYYAQDGCP